MMNTKIYRTFNENDIEIHNNGISVEETFFSKKQIADAFNELILMKNFIEQQSIND